MLPTYLSTLLVLVGGRVGGGWATKFFCALPGVGHWKPALQISLFIAHPPSSLYFMARP